MSNDRIDFSQLGKGLASTGRAAVADLHAKGIPSHHIEDGKVVEVPPPSLLGRTLARLLDSTDVFDREDWAARLGVSGGELWDWCRDRAVPGPGDLLVILMVVEGNAPADSQGPLREWEAIRDRPTAEVTPLAGELRGAPTLQAYLELSPTYPNRHLLAGPVRPEGWRGRR